MNNHNQQPIPDSIRMIKKSFTTPPMIAMMIALGILSTAYLFITVSFFYTSAQVSSAVSEYIPPNITYSGARGLLQTMGGLAVVCTLFSVVPLIGTILIYAQSKNRTEDMIPSSGFTVIQVYAIISVIVCTLFMFLMALGLMAGNSETNPISVIIIFGTSFLILFKNIGLFLSALSVKTAIRGRGFRKNGLSMLQISSVILGVLLIFLSALTLLTIYAESGNPERIHNAEYTSLSNARVAYTVIFLIMLVIGIADFILFRIARKSSVVMFMAQNSQNAYNRNMTNLYQSTYTGGSPDLQPNYQNGFYNGVQQNPYPVNQQSPYNPSYPTSQSNGYMPNPSEVPQYPPNNAPNPYQGYTGAAQNPYGNSTYPHNPNDISGIPPYGSNNNNT